MARAPVGPGASEAGKACGDSLKNWYISLSKYFILVYIVKK